MKLALSTWYDGFNTSLSLSKEISLVSVANILKCFLISLFLLIGQMSVCNTDDFKLFPYLAAHTHITSDLLFGPWCHKDMLVYQLF